MPRSISVALALTASVWAFGAHVAAGRAAEGLSGALHVTVAEPLLRASFLLFLATTGFTAIHWIATRAAVLTDVNRMPGRPTARLEWALGAVVGWALALAVVLPVVIARDLTPSLWWSGRSVLASAVAVLTLAVATLASEVLFRGYIFARLSDATSPAVGGVIVSCVYAVAVAWLLPGETRVAVAASFVFSLLLCFAYRRTRALWTPWGLHFAWAAMLAVVFGLPVNEAALFTGVVDSTVQGRAWLTGGTQAGPEGSLLAVCFALGAMGLVYALTRDLAWQYTAPEIVGAAYAMEVAPPKAHTDMETAAAAKVPLVQILASTPAEPSTSQAVREHLASGER